jgi:quercetin dioxygenase-like cupin family protein
MLNQVVVRALHAAIVCFTLSGWGLGPEAEAVESHGVTLQVLKEEEVDGLVKGKHRMRAIEITAEPGQPIGELARGSFGIGYIFTGAITSVDEPSQSYKAGQAVIVTPLNNRRYKNGGENTVKMAIFEITPMTDGATDTSQRMGTAKIRLERDVGLAAGKHKMILARGKIARGGFAGEHVHRGAEMRAIISGSLTMAMHKETEVYKEGEYFFEPADTHMMKVEGDKSKDTEFIIFEIGTVRDVDSIYHPDAR